MPATVLALSAALALGLAETLTRYLYRGTTVDNGGYFSRRWWTEHPPRKNRLGFREREVTAHPDSGVYRIAVVGDSFTFGSGLAEEDRMTNIVERRLNGGGGRRYEVLNFGRSGAETVDHIVILEQSVLGIHPHFVLLQWYTNDVEGHDKKDRPERQVRPLLPSGVTRRLITKSAFYSLVDRQLWQLRIRLAHGHRPRESYLVRRFADPQSPDAREAEAALLRFVAIAKAAGLPVGIVAFPDLTEDLMGSYPLGFLIDRVMAVCGEVSIPCVDLRAVFAHAPPPDRLWVSRLDRHPNRLANELATDAVLGRFAPLWSANIRAPGELATTTETATRR